MSPSSPGDEPSGCKRFPTQTQPALLDWTSSSVSLTHRTEVGLILRLLSVTQEVGWNVLICKPQTNNPIWKEWGKVDMQSPFAGLHMACLIMIFHWRICGQELIKIRAIAWVCRLLPLKSVVILVYGCMCVCLYTCVCIYIYKPTAAAGGGLQKAAGRVA